MGTLSERSNEQIMKKLIKRKKGVRLAGAVLAVVILAVLGLVIYNAVRTKSYVGYEKIESFERTDSNTVKYLSYEGELLKYSRDGASAIDGNGKVLWNGSYEMKDPIIDTCGKYVAIADDGGKEVYVYNGADSGTMFTVEYPISMVKIASQGVVAVVLEDNDSNVIQLYNPYGETDKLLVEIPTNISTDGYPVDIALSRDGKSLVSSYVFMRGGIAESNICFYNFSEVGQDKNRVVGGCNFEDVIAGKLEFVGNDTVCILTNNGFSVYSNMKQPKEICSETFDQEIKSAMLSEGKIGFIFGAQQEGQNRMLQIYNSSGKEILKKEIDFEYDEVNIAGDEIMFATETEARIIRMNGSSKLKCKFASNMEYFFKSEREDIYYAIDANEIYRIKLIEE